MAHPKASLLRKAAVMCAVGAPLLWFVLAPFPGMRMVYAIDHLAPELATSKEGVPIARR